MRRYPGLWFKILFVVLVIVSIVVTLADYLECDRVGGQLVRGMFGPVCLEAKR